MNPLESALLRYNFSVGLNYHGTQTTFSRKNGQYHNGQKYKKIVLYLNYQNLCLNSSWLLNRDYATLLINSCACFLDSALSIADKAPIPKDRGGALQLVRYILLCVF